jgi:dTDP-glucose 4,6-dehydratase
MHTVDLLRARGNHVSTVSRSRRSDAGTILADLGQAEEIRKLPKHLDCVVHLAALLPAPTRQYPNDAWFLNNTQSTLNVLQFCASNGIAKFVYGSTWSVYGRMQGKGAITEETSPRPVDLYSLSKRSGEILTYPYAFTCDMEVKVLRFSYIYGRGMRGDTVVSKFIDLGTRNEPIPLIGQGKDQTDLVYVKDAADAVQAALFNGQGTYNIGSGKPATIRELAETVVATTGSTSRLEFTADTGEPKGGYLCIEKAARELMWKPRYALASGLEDMIDELKRSRP